MNGVAKNLWILTEERPKTEVLQMIFEYFAKDQGLRISELRAMSNLQEEATMDAYLTP